MSEHYQFRNYEVSPTTTSHQKMDTAFNMNVDWIVGHEVKIDLPVRKTQGLKTSAKKYQKSKLPLMLSVGIFSTLIGVAYLAFPSPFNYMGMLAMAGPLAASIMALRR